MGDGLLKSLNRRAQQLRDEERALEEESERSVDDWYDRLRRSGSRVNRPG